MSEPKPGVSLDDEEARSKREKMDLKNAKAREKRREQVGFGIRCLGSMKDAKEFLNEGLQPKRKYTRKSVGVESCSTSSNATKRPKRAKSKSGHLAHTGSDRSRPAESLTDSSVAGNIEWNTEHDGLFLSELLPNEKSFDTERSQALERLKGAIDAAVLKASLESSCTPQKERTPEDNWSKRIDKIEEQCTLNREKYAKARISALAPNLAICEMCHSELSTAIVTCSTCQKNMCSRCDQAVHCGQPFHRRRVYSSKENHVSLLKPTSFVDEYGQLFEMTIPVPLSVPSVCPGCNSRGTFCVSPGKGQKIVVTTGGRYDLSSAAFSCQNDGCGYYVEASKEDYVRSQFWPGAPENSPYLFDEDVLALWFHLRNKCPGTSLSKFLETLECMSRLGGRSTTINRLMFYFASREYEFFMHKVDADILLVDLGKCPGCGNFYLAGHMDGNFELCRYHKNKSGGNDKSVYGNIMIATEEEVKAHVTLIDTEIAPERITNDCGGFRAVAVQSTEGKKKDETGCMIVCCRHGIILGAADMFQGETFRHAHFLHYKLHQLGCLFLCYDVVCKYWLWAEKVEKNPNLKAKFAGMTTKMHAFLSRMHAVAHIWYCYILWVGHWQRGPGATVGEEQEQVNSYLSPHGAVIKHKTKNGRRDHVTSAFLYWNVEKVARMPTTLADRLTRAVILFEAYTSELKDLLAERKLTMEDLPKILQEMVSLASKHQGSPLSASKNPMASNMECLIATFTEMKNLQRMKEKTAVGKKSRQHFSSAMSKTKKKAQKLIEAINTEHKESVIASRAADPMARGETLLGDDGINEDPVDPYVTMDHFERGEFPNQTGETNEYRKNHFLIDTWMLRDRYREEIVHSEREMDTFLKTTTEKIDNLGQEREKILLELANKFEVNSNDDDVNYLCGKAALIQLEKEKQLELLRFAGQKFQQSLRTEDLLEEDAYESEHEFD